MDDAPVDRALVGGLVEKHLGLKPIYAASGREALERLEHASPLLVLADLQMPEMDGLELVKALREEKPNLPVVIITAHGSEELAVQALKSGAANYLAKRNLTRELVPVVESVLNSVATEQQRRRMFACLNDCRIHFTLPSDPALLPPLVSHFHDLLTGMDFSTANNRLRTRVALEEALLNALHHGNLEVSSELKHQSDKAYQDLVTQRARQSPYKDRHIEVLAQLQPREAHFVIRDEGAGYDPCSLPDPTDPVNLERACGRGLLLIRTFMDEVRIDRAGTEITLVVRSKSK